MSERRKTRKKSAGRTVLIAAVIILSLLLLAVIGWLVALQQPGPQLSLEAGSPLPRVEDFLPNAGDGAAFVGDLSGVDMTVPGQYTLQIADGLMRYTATLTVQDTTAPTATVKDATVMYPSTISPEELVTDIQDVTAVTVAFAGQPDFSQPGEQTVTLVLTDAAGNTAQMDAVVTVLKDTTAPTISGVRNLTVYAGETIAYRSGVSVSDDYDEAVTLSIDSSKVDLSTVGVYTVIYSATDASGNTATKEATVTVQEKPENYVDPEVIYARIDAILAQFITDDMTDREKVEAVYVWTHRGDHLIYGSAPDRTDYLQTAYEFLDRKKGDCYWFFAIQKVMLERLGIPTIDVKKVKNFEKDSNHYWLLVSIDQGQTYYHFDNVWSRNLCLVTDKVLNNFSKACNGCFNRDESLYPATPTTDLPASKLPWNNEAIKNAKP